jgi:hypothetical protein
VAVRTLTNYLPYTAKIWHRPCFDEHKRETAAASARGRALVPAA